jgi:peptidoglycan/LPS O-acetylase OafA/YrhL
MATTPRIGRAPSAVTHLHLRYIDGLRALAALSVLVYHAWTGPSAVYTTFADRFLTMGAHGVDLFFVISGFCLAYPTIARHRAGSATRFDTASYFARRLVRIIPPYYAAIVVLALVFTAFHLHSDGLSPAALVSQFLFLDKYPAYLSGTFWTLPVELRWYVAFPALLALYLRTPRIFAVLGLAAYGLYYGTRDCVVDVGTLPAFMLGIWAADLQVRQSPLRRYAAAVGLPCAFFAFALGEGQQFYGVQPVGVVACFCFVVAGGAIGWLRQGLSTRLLTMFGVASYSIYLIHKPVLEYAESIRHAPQWLAALVALGVSMLFWLIFERPWLLPSVRDPATRWVQRALEPLARWLRIPADTAEVRAPGKVLSGK